jgi:hypothetical protein
MPGTVRVIFAVFFLVPVLSSGAGWWPTELWESGPPLAAILSLVTYWILPLLICFSIAWKHHWFLPLYLLQCVSLVTHASVYSETLPWDLLILRYGLVALMAYIGILFGNRDFLYPFVTKSSRLWRMAPRIDVELHLYLADENGHNKIPAMMVNCSLTGMAITVDSRHLHGPMRKKGPGSDLTAILRWQERDRVVPLRIVWSNEQSETVRYGLQVTDHDVMNQFMEWLKEWHSAEMRFNPAARPLLTRDRIGTTAVMLWVISILLAFGLPAFAGMVVL